MSCIKYRPCYIKNSKEDYKRALFHGWMQETSYSWIHQGMCLNIVGIVELEGGTVVTVPCENIKFADMDKIGVSYE